MSWEYNKPNNKSCQTFECVHPWETKHIIGTQGKKIKEFRDYEGITRITQSKFVQNRFLIEGKIHAVNKVIEDMGKWLKECQNMHYANGIF